MRASPGERYDTNDVNSNFLKSQTRPAHPIPFAHDRRGTMNMYGAVPRLERGLPRSKTARPWLVPAVVTLLALATVFVHAGEVLVRAQRGCDNLHLIQWTEKRDLEQSISGVDTDGVTLPPWVEG